MTIQFTNKVTSSTASKRAIASNKMKTLSLTTISFIGTLLVYSALVTHNSGGNSNAFSKRRELLSYKKFDMPITPGLLEQKVAESPLQCMSTPEPIDDWGRFEGKTIYMLGDSLMRDQFKAICKHGNLNQDVLEKEGSDKFKLMPSKFLLINFQKYVRMCYDESGSTRFLYRYQRYFEPSSVSLVHNLYQDYINRNSPTPYTIQDPDAIYFNGGLHLLQVPHTGFRPGLWNVYVGVEHYVHKFLNEAFAVSPNAHVVYMNSHSICEAKFHGTWGDYLLAVQKDPMTVVANCVRELVNEYGEADIKTDQAMRGCITSPFTESGVLNINHRIESSIATYMTNHDLYTKRIGCVDGHAITTDRCDYTRDGRHYPGLVPQELNSFTMVLDV
mmetsp:Transcript_8137/g.11724  ORF Transcript_8137/g.11724 Transcript_8137/m.11724 type:complete len:387 (-) Transcript_8137:261-1421(-)